MFKKAAYYIMTFLLLLSIIGISINKHYSGSKLYSVSVVLDAESCCEGSCDCCEDTSEIVKLTDSFLKTVFQFESKVKAFNLFTLVYFFDKNPFLSNNKQSNSVNNFPIKIPKLNTVSFLQSFRL